MPLLFSYGTLQLPQVQIDTFGRLLDGEADELLGFSKTMMEITDPAVLVSSGARFHPIVARSNNSSERITGIVFDMSDEELEKADSYEVSDYKREIVDLASGRSAWLYVKS
ncbi:gamma-glutamylcyclotransferase family protein [Litorimonas sp.]|uniref:gamma-glutamylcyclotransferase family protein n=1 Tax=Litorimonas sp. TaxID=1892381 RepID=UPI003A8936D3